MSGMHQEKKVTLSKLPEPKGDALSHEQTYNELQEIIELQQIEIDTLKRKYRWLYNEYNQMKNSLSWKITFPIRLIQKAIQRLIFSFKTLINDTFVGFYILKRDGIPIFLYRLGWYFRGKRLKEDVELSKHKHTTTDQNTQFDFSKTIEIPQCSNPLVSIIIPAYNHFPETCRCVKSVVENSGDIKYEIIIIDDHSSDDHKVLSKVLHGAKFIRNEKNLGFLRSCNKAAKKAIGKYIHFLNNDTIVHPEWLDSLLMVFEKSEKTGIVGSKLIYPNRKLQEAGGIIWNDATGWNFGKLDDSEKSEYNYLKEVDYVSGASLMIKRYVWEELGGFDERFVPAYYEDTDLAYRVRKLGLKVIYQPKSLVSHFEGLSNGTNEDEGIKKYQYINRQKFLKKWQSVLDAEASPNGKDVFLHRDRSANKKQILVIDHHIPRFDQDAGSRSTFTYLKLFVNLGYSVKFFGQNFYRFQPYTEILQQLGIEVLYGDFYQRNIGTWLKENGKYFDFVVLHRIQVAQKYIKIIKKYSNAKLAYVGHDLQFISSLKKLELSTDKKYQRESRKYKKIETKIFNTVDVIFPFSTYEALFISEIAPDKIVRTLPVFFYDSIPQIDLNFDNRNDILFVASFDHPPNLDAVLWFCKEIFPRVKKRVPDIKLNIVGSNPSDEIKQLESNDINVTGYVSDQKLEAYYMQSKIAVLPLRYGAGVKGKLIESLYYQIPTVITSIAAEGVPEIENYSMIADDTESFADRICELSANKEVWENYAKNSKELIKKYYTSEAAKETIQEVI